MSEDGIRVTVVVACYNHADYVEQALRSVFHQEGAKVQVIITDDASSDDTQFVVEQLLERNEWMPAVKIFHTQNRGICATFNEALAHVATPFVAFMSADDWMFPDRIRKQLEFFDSLGENVAVVHTRIQPVDPLGETVEGSIFERFNVPVARRNKSAHLDPREIRTSHPIATPSVLMRSAAVRGVGGYDEGLNAEDIDMWFRLSRSHEFAYLDETLTYYRVGQSGSLSDELTRRGKYAEDYLAIIRKHYGRSVELDRWLAEWQYTIAKEMRRARQINPWTAARLMRRHSVYSLQDSQNPKPFIRFLLAALWIK